MIESHAATTNVDRLAETAMRWYGWGSPVGLGVFIVCLSLAGLVTAKAVGSLSDLGTKGTQMERPASDGRR